MTLDEIRKLIDEATPGPWKHDLGNWEVEGPRPDRYPICSMTPDNRAPGFEGQAPNPVSPLADGAFIAAARTLLPALLEVAALAKIHVKNGRMANAQRLAGALAALEALKLP